MPWQLRYNIRPMLKFVRHLFTYVRRRKSQILISSVNQGLGPKFLPVSATNTRDDNDNDHKYKEHSSTNCCDHYDWIVIIFRMFCQDLSRCSMMVVVSRVNIRFGCFNWFGGRCLCRWCCWGRGCGWVS